MRRIFYFLFLAVFFAFYIRFYYSSITALLQLFIALINYILINEKIYDRISKFWKIIPVIIFITIIFIEALFIKHISIESLSLLWPLVSTNKDGIIWLKNRILND